MIKCLTDSRDGISSKYSLKWFSYNNAVILEFYCDSTCVWTVHAAESSEIGKCRYSFLHNRNTLIMKHTEMTQEAFSSEIASCFFRQTSTAGFKETLQEKSTTEAFKVPNLIWDITFFDIFRVINYSKEKKIEYFFSETISDISYKGILVL